MIGQINVSGSDRRHIRLSGGPVGGRVVTLDVPVPRVLRTRAPVHENPFAWLGELGTSVAQTAVYVLDSDARVWIYRLERLERSTVDDLKHAECVLITPNGSPLQEAGVTPTLTLGRPHP